MSGASPPTSPVTLAADRATDWFYRCAASGKLPPRLFAPRRPPAPEERAAPTGPLHVENVSHCWRYAHLLVYQLSALALHPPERTRVTATVFHCPEDEATVRLLEYFGTLEVPGVEWNWQPLSKHEMFRRSIGRNRAAKASRADWIWFNDCDILFGEGCLDALAGRLQGRREALFYPRHERHTSLLPEDHAVLEAGRGEPRLLDLPDVAWHWREFPKATGGVQITHGDVARAAGYCDGIATYQRPAERWRKTREDRVFRWVLGTQGEPVDVPALYRIRHAVKGRYHGSSLSRGFRSRVRRTTSWWAERRAASRGPAASAERSAAGDE